jgi:hypothetical protein
MKKFLVGILAVFYLTSAMGATVHLHYCMDKLVGWSLWYSGDKCSKCGMKKTQSSKKGCCHDEYKVLKAQKDQKLSGNFVELTKNVKALAPVSILPYSSSLPAWIVQEQPRANAPPRSCLSSLHILNCIFRI